MAAGVGAMKTRLARVALYAALAAGAVMALLPLVWMVSASLMPAGMANTYPPRLLPRTVTFEHYETLFTRLNLTRYLVNSSIIALAITAFSLLITPAALALSRHHERQADRFGLALTGDKHAAASAFVALQEQNLAVPRPGRLYKLWRASHPPIGERVDAINATPLPPAPVR